MGKFSLHKKLLHAKSFNNYFKLSDIVSTSHFLKIANGFTSDLDFLNRSQKGYTVHQYCETQLNFSKCIKTKELYSIYCSSMAYSYSCFLCHHHLQPYCFVVVSPFPITTLNQTFFLLSFLLSSSLLIISFIQLASSLFSTLVFAIQL